MDFNLLYKVSSESEEEIKLLKGAALKKPIIWRQKIPEFGYWDHGEQVDSG